MANTNFFKKFVNGLCLKPIDVGVNAKDETGITTTGAIWVYTNKIKAYLDSAVREILTADQTQTITNKSIDGDSNTIINLTHGDQVDNPSTGVHGVNGTIVGDTDTQTLTNKTIDVDANTVSNIDTDNIKSAAKTGIDAKVVTGTNGTADNFAKWNSDGDLIDSGNSAPTGNIVGDSDAQTLTNKTMDANSNTISNLEHGSEVDNPSSGVHGVVGSVVGTTDTQTLSNKTFSDNVIIGGDLTVNGTTTTLDTDNLVVEDANITVNNGGNDLSSEGAGLTIERTSTDGSLVYEDALGSKFKAGALGSEIELVNVSSSQDLSNKAIKTPSQSDVKTDTEANLTTYASTASNGQICFATDTKTMYQIVDSALTEIGSGGAGDADTISLTQADDIEVSDIDLSGNNSDFDGGGTITASSLTISTTAADLLTGTTQVIKYDPDADGSDDYFGFTKSIPIGQRGRELAFQFNYKNDSTTVDDDFRFCVKIKDGSNAGDLNYYDLEAFNNSDNTGTIYSGASYIPSDCTEVEFGWQNTSTTTTVQLHVDNILISQSPYIYKDLVNMTDAESYTPTFSNIVTSSSDARWYRQGAFLVVDFNFVVTSASSGEARMTLPTGLVTASTLPTISIVGHGGGKQNVATQYSVLAEPSKTYLTFGVSDGSNNLLTKKDGAGIYNAYEYSYQAKVQIEGWTAESEHVVTPRTGQKQYSQANGDFTVTGTNWTTGRAVIAPYKTQEGTWRAKINIGGTVSSGTTSLILTISGMTFKNSQQQSLAAHNSGGTVGGCQAIAAHNASTITIQNATSVAGMYTSGDVELDSKPTWADDTTTNYLAATPTSDKLYSHANGDFTMTGSASGTVDYCECVPYQLQNGEWRMKFNLSFTRSSSSTLIYVYIPGITFPARVQSASCSPSGSGNADWFFATIPASNNRIDMRSSGNYTTFISSGDVAIASKPTWMD